jgi:carboxyl-terminal processing protease
MSKKMKIVMIGLVSIVCLALSFGAGCALESQTTSDSVQALDIVREAWDLIFTNYVDKDKLEESTLAAGAIKGMVEALDDPHCSYLTADSFQLSQSHWEGKFEGIGAYVGEQEGNIVIIAPIAGSPAEKAGIQAGDTILEIDGKSVSGMSLMEAVLKIRGPGGTPVLLLVLHQGATEPEEIEIIRAEIEIPSVTLEMREDIAYVKITNFTERTGNELAVVLREINQEKASGIVLDLRSNPGGLLNTVVDVSGYFLDKGIVYYMVDKEGEKTATPVKRKSLQTGLPLVVLVDSYSASGSELLAGALQDNSRAIIAGTKTYGKGSVNVPYRLKDGSGLYLATARWLTPSGNLIEGEGIQPDYTLELEGEDAIQWAIEYLKENK